MQYPIGVKVQVQKTRISLVVVKVVTCSMNLMIKGNKDRDMVEKKISRFIDKGFL